MRNQDPRKAFWVARGSLLGRAASQVRSGQGRWWWLRWRGEREREREVCEGDDDLKHLFGEDSLGIFLFSLIAICWELKKFCFVQVIEKFVQIVSRLSSRFAIYLENSRSYMNLSLIWFMNLSSLSFTC